MPRSEFASRFLVDCRDARGNKIKVGAAVTRDGEVIPLCPSGHIPVLNIEQTYELIDAFRLAAQDAAIRSG